MHSEKWRKNMTILIKEEKWEDLTQNKDCGCWHCGLVSIERIFINEGKFCNNTQEAALYLNNNKKLNWNDALMLSPINIETLITMVDSGLIDVNHRNVAKAFIFHFSPFSKGCSVDIQDIQDIQDEYGDSLLIIANKWWCTSDNITRFLLEHGADPLLENKR